MKKSSHLSKGIYKMLKFLCFSTSIRSSDETKETSGGPSAETARTTPDRGMVQEIASQPRRFSFNELSLATRNFRREDFLGMGGFGPVYKGWINENPVKPGTGLAVAVKILNRYGVQGHREWLAEVHFLQNLHHQNLVKLVGYCMEGHQRLIVYEFMARGSLENHLFRSVVLPWCTRIRIALGAAQGLAYLHEETQKPVIYRDFKASNILLDADYNAKLSDFGLARDGPEGDQTHVSTRVMGTFGYAAPEYLMTGHLTVKSDVYSFGVVLLEILSGRKAMDKNQRMGEHYLVSWAQPYLGNKHHFWRIIDPRLGGHFSKKGALKCTEIASLCLRMNPKLRPQMSEIVEMLMHLPSTSEFRDADDNSNSNNLEAKNKHVAGNLNSPTGSNASPASYTLSNKQKGKRPVRS
ncbi:hypothetical protein EJD97_000825 [Solanum chilense]|uniref:non-specific serine/threonine protein kinase n=1 Tax=Solanum chilense TaxID=4083 RepID=A0A6N2C287_SOLCI|nr:hypothetical protein EJD97_000825 [Solanum chilense]